MTASSSTPAQSSPAQYSVKGIMGRRVYLEKSKQLGVRDLASRRRLEVGRSGPDVQQLQLYLVDEGYYSGASDGYFGEGTRHALERWQRDVGIPATGAFDVASKEQYLRRAEGYFMGSTAEHVGDKALLGSSSTGVTGVILTGVILMVALVVAGAGRAATRATRVGAVARKAPTGQKTPETLEVPRYFGGREFLEAMRKEYGSGARKTRSERRTLAATSIPTREDTVDTVISSLLQGTELEQRAVSKLH